MLRVFTVVVQTSKQIQTIMKLQHRVVRLDLGPIKNNKKNCVPFKAQEMEPGLGLEAFSGGVSKLFSLAVGGLGEGQYHLGS